MDIYRELREKLDTLGVGYTQTEDGSEMHFLERFFTPKQARYFILMPDNRFVTAKEMAELLGKDESDIADDLYEMSKQGLLFRQRTESGDPLYRTVPFVHGLYEFQLGRVDAEWPRYMEKHYMDGWGKTLNETGIPINRSIPIHAEVVSEATILPYDDLEQIIYSKKRWAVADCICRLKGKAKGKGCDHELESCLVFDSFADYYLENELARKITAEEALEIVRQGQKDGRVAQASNAIDCDVICTCCTCACGLLGAYKYFPGPTNETVSNYRCTRDASKCLENCPKTCTKRCPVGAFKVVDGEVQYKPKKCIGCGLCVSTCPGKALILVRKPESELYKPPQTIFDAYEQMQQIRGF